MKKGLRRAAALLLIFAMVLALGSVPAFAKTKTITLKGADYTNQEKDIKKTAKKVKKGTYLIKSKGDKGGYLKFTVPKTKTYKFTVSHYSTGKFYCNGYWNIQTKNKDNSNFYAKKVKTQGGYNTAMYVSSRSNTSGEKRYRFLESRYAKTKLQKGQTVYIYIKYTDGEVKLKIK